ncbi:alkylated DNA repair protein domain-containing protein, partial [Nocardioides malaquae]|uniref:alkylated DNA repair protein domain-containing protein n=1 Tax=Nocardioides malaquae TaxID=2773426 RepID=UPI001D0CEF30
MDEDLTWSTNTAAIVKKAHQRMHFLRVLRNNKLSQELLVSFYRCSIESILTYCINLWFGCCTAAERTTLQRVVNTASRRPG